METKKSREINVYDEKGILRDTFFYYDFKISLNEILENGKNNNFGYDYDFEISEIREVLEGTNKFLFLNKDLLDEEINKRDYEDIIGLKCEIVEDEFNYYYEVLPIKETKEGFFLMECLNENNYFFFTQKEDKFFCEVRDIFSEDITREELIEEDYI